MEKNLKQENISFSKGIRRTPTTGESGELSECVNLMPKAGEMVNIPGVYQLSDNVNVTSGRKLGYIHHKSGTYGYKNYITYDNSGVYVENGSSTLLSVKPVSITSVGNTLCVSSASGINYFLWKNGAYVDLGNHIPEVGVNFGLVGDYIDYYNTKLEVVIPVNRSTGEGCYVESNRFGIHSDAVTDNIQHFENLSSLVHASINECEEKLKKIGRFTYPFFVCCAIRLYDGSYTMQSIPVLMVPSTDGLPVPMLYGWSYDGGNYRFGCVVQQFASKLTMQVDNYDSLSDWSDIIKGVDVFVSVQHQRYKEGGMLDSRSVTRYTSGTQISERNGSAPFLTTAMAKRCIVPVGQEDTSSEVAFSSSEPDLVMPYDYLLDTTDKAAQSWSVKTINGPSVTLSYGASGRKDYLANDAYCCGEPKLKLFSDAEWANGFKQENSFYLLRKFRLEEISEFSIRRAFSIEDNILNTISTRESLDMDVSYSHDRFTAQKLMSYNNRLLLADTCRTLGNSIQFESAMTYITGDSNNCKYRAYIRFDYYGVDYYVKLSSSIDMNLEGGLRYFFYPDSRAKEVYIYGDAFACRLDLTIHPLLNGAYWFNAMSPAANQYGSMPKTETELISLVEPAVIDLTNTLMVSEVSNPFVFKESSSVSLPSRILNISTAAKALSEGQFGQFPLYAFCEDGIWAMTVANTGSFSASQPVSRDIALPDSITQIDNAVLFVTKQGLKIIQGSETKLLSGRLDGLNLAETYFTASIPEALRYDDVDELSDYMQTATLVYDYANQLVHAFKPDCKMHYVYSLETGEFSKQMLSGKLLASVPGYPTSTMQMDDNKLYEYRKQTSNSTTNGYLITRPCYLGNPMARKALMQIKTLGFKTNQNSSFSIAVYVSNNLRQWTRLSSLKGMSALYYRFVVKTTMLDVDALSGMTVLYQERYLNKLI